MTRQWKHLVQIDAFIIVHFRRKLKQQWRNIKTSFCQKKNTTIKINPITQFKWRMEAHKMEFIYSIKHTYLPICCRHEAKLKYNEGKYFLMSNSHMLGNMSVNTIYSIDLMLRLLRSNFMESFNSDVCQKNWKWLSA